MPEWDAEITIDAALVRDVLGGQFPDLDAGSARVLGEGWDNSVWVVEDAWAFRFPRRKIAIPGVEREIAVLPLLAPLLPAPIPDPQFVGVPSERFPWPFFGGPLLAGQEAADAGLDDEDRAELGAELGTFLRVLHGVELDIELPVEPLGRADMAIRVPRARQCIAEVEAAGIWPAPSRVAEILAAAEELRRSDRTAVVHGDLHARHVLVDGGLSAVIDWGDVCAGDPSVDLSLPWSFLPDVGRARFVEAYGQIDDDRLLRARATALYFCAMLGTYAHSVGNEALERECLAGLERTLVDRD